MVIVEIEHGLIYRKFQVTKPTSKDHVRFLNEAKQYYAETFNMQIVSIQMDNAPEYAKSHNPYEVIAHDDFVKSVGD
jgi:disulfide oxidoreductase YuzD